MTYTYIGDYMKVFTITKKEIVLFVCFATCICGIIFASVNATIQTNATPATNKTVILDAGHGIPDYGTESASGTTEQELNLAITLKLQQLLEQSGTKVVLTRSDDNGIYEVDKDSIRAKKISDMKNRVYIGNNSNADIYVSIHMNYYTDSQYSGWQTFYQSKNEKSKKIANIIQQSLNENIGQNKRVPMAIKGAYIMDKVKIPAVIVECGFLSNKSDEKKLKTAEYQSKLAWGIYVGIQKYFVEE